MTEKQINPFPKTEGRVAGVALAEGGMVFLKWQDGSQYGYLRDAAPYGRLCPIAFDFLESLAIQQQAAQPAEQPRGEPVARRQDERDVCRALSSLKRKLFDANALDAEAAALHSAGRDAFLRIVKATRDAAQPAEQPMGDAWDRAFPAIDPSKPAQPKPERAVGDGAIGYIHDRDVEYLRGGNRNDWRCTSIASAPNERHTFPVYATPRPAVATDGDVVTNAALVQAIAKHQFSDEHRRGRLTIDVETLLAEYNALASRQDPNIPTELDELRLQLVEAIEERDHLRKYLATAGDGVTGERAASLVGRWTSRCWPTQFATDAEYKAHVDAMDFCARELSEAAALASRPVEASKGGVLDGYKVVPVEPTKAMRKAGAAEVVSWGSTLDPGSVYRAMLAAAPEVDRG